MLVGMTYVYLPHGIAALCQFGQTGSSLTGSCTRFGATPWKTFWLITVPMSRAGIAAGAILVFIPCLGEFVIPSLLGGAENIMIGRVVWDEMFSSNNWPRASALSIVLILGVVLPLAWFNQRMARKVEEENG
jgi:putrescine transport system permease protein